MPRITVCSGGTKITTECATLAKLRENTKLLTFLGVDWDRVRAEVNGEHVQTATKQLHSDDTVTFHPRFAGDKDGRVCEPSQSFAKSFTHFTVGFITGLGTAFLLWFVIFRLL